MRKQKILIVFIILLLILNSVTAFFLFQNNRRAHKGPSRPDPEFITKRLELTKEQQQQFEQMRKSHFEKRDAQRSEDQKLKELMIEMISNSVQDSSKIDSITSLLATNRKKFETETYQHFLILNSLLTTTQKEKFKEVLTQIMTRQNPPQGPPPPNH